MTMTMVNYGSQLLQHKAKGLEKTGYLCRSSLVPALFHQKSCPFLLGKQYVGGKVCYVS